MSRKTRKQHISFLASGSPSPINKVNTQDKLTINRNSLRRYENPACLDHRLEIGWSQSVTDLRERKKRPLNDVLVYTSINANSQLEPIHHEATRPKAIPSIII